MLAQVFTGLVIDEPRLLVSLRSITGCREEHFFTDVCSGSTATGSMGTYMSALHPRVSVARKTRWARRRRAHLSRAARRTRCAIPIAPIEGAAIGDARSAADRVCCRGYRV